MMNLQALDQTYHFKTTLKDASYDSQNQLYLSDLSTEVYDFDKIKEVYAKNTSVLLSNKSLLSFRSNDALYQKGERLVFIEFKNGKITSEREKEKIRSKISESLLILADILNTTLSELRKDCYYILVYNKQHNTSFESERNTSLHKLTNTIAKLSNTTHLIRGFDRYKVFFNTVYTINETELEHIIAAL